MIHPGNTRKFVGNLKLKTMGTIIYVIGVVCAVWCVLDILKQNISMPGKVIASVLLLLTSWVGIAVYYFWGRHNLTRWFK